MLNSYYFTDYQVGVSIIKRQLKEAGFSEEHINCLEYPEGCPVLYWHIAIFLDKIFVNKKHDQKIDIKSMFDAKDPDAFQYLHYLLRTAFIEPVEGFEFEKCWKNLATGWFRLFFLERKINFDPFFWAYKAFSYDVSDCKLVKKMPFGIETFQTYTAIAVTVEGKTVIIQEFSNNQGES